MVSTAGQAIWKFEIFAVDDIVEVDGMTGTVTSIGVRDSTPDVRKDIRINVGYGSDPILVRDILLDIADKHNLIQTTPGPVVTLEDFGDNGLLFNLQIWIRIQPGVSSLQVMSDVRFEMLRRLGKAGIDLPYPQRVVHIAKDKEAAPDQTGLSLQAKP